MPSPDLPPTIEAMNLVKRQHPAPTTTLDRRERAADLRARAATVRDEIAAQERALQKLRDVDEAGQLEAQARELDLEQDRDERAAELRHEADAVETDAAELDAQAERLNAELVETLLRAARFPYQLTAELAGRRQALQQASAAAAAAGDADALLETERDLATLPTIEQRLQEQLDAAAARADELSEAVARVEAHAAKRHAYAALLRRHADGDPLAPLHDPDEHLPEGRTFGDCLHGRRVALAAVRQLPNLREQVAETIAEALMRERRSAIITLRLEQAVRPLEGLPELVEHVRTAALADSARWNGRLDADDRGEGIRTPPTYPAARRALAESIATYESRTGRVLPTCTTLATAPFRRAADVDRASGEALAELEHEREQLRAVAEAQPV